MSKRMLHCFPVAIVIATALALSGCGGGSNTRTDTDTGMTGGTDTGMTGGTDTGMTGGTDTGMTGGTDTGMTGGTDTGMTGGTDTGMTDDPTLTVRDGLAQSAATPVHAGSANDTLATLLPDATNQFAPLSSTLRMDWGESTTAPANDSHIKTIASDGSNGFHVTYVVGDDERMIHFEEADYIVSDYGFYKEVDGANYWFWSWTNAYHGADKNLGSSRYTYVDLGGASAYHEDDDDAEDEGARDRSYLSYGARTDAANLPAGSATYTGIVTAETFLVGDPNRSQSESMRSNLRLTANFDDSTLDGMIFGIRVRTRGDENSWNEWSALSDTTHFEIGDGQIADGQFTATLTGVDSNAAAPSDETVSGYEGGILGEFYGPAAEEVAGVLNASRNDRVMQGVFAGKQGDADAPSSATGLNRSTASPVYATATGDVEDLVDQGSRFAPLSSALRRDWYEVSAKLDDDSYVKTIWVEGDFDDGTGKLHVTYLVDGEEQAVYFEAADYIEDGSYFEKEVDGYSSVWSVVGSFSDNSEYTYLDIWGFNQTGGDDFSIRGFASYGARTDAANLPAGSATYVGRMRADTFKQNLPSTNSSRVRVYGDLNLTANFGGSTLEGTISGIHTRGQNEASSSPLSSTTQFEIANGQIANGQFTATLTGVDSNATAPLHESVRGYEGHVLGEFYGPAAEEVGGVLSASREEDLRVMNGAFHGKKQ